MTQTRIDAAAALLSKNREQISAELRLIEFMQSLLKSHEARLRELADVAQALRTQVGDPPSDTEIGSEHTSAPDVATADASRMEESSEAPDDAEPDLSELPIAAACVEVARRSELHTANAAQMSEALEEAGYRSTSRSSVYQALLNASKSPERTMVSKNGTARGEFRFYPRPVAAKLEGATLIEAATEVARARGQQVVSPSDITDWLAEAGFVTRRQQIPSRNSVNTALQNAVRDGRASKRGRGAYVLFGTEDAPAATSTDETKSDAMQPDPKEERTRVPERWIDAIVEEAARRRAPRATAAQIAGWMKDAGYRTRRGSDVYGTVYSSLQHELRKDDSPVQKTGRTYVLPIEGSTSNVSEDRIVEAALGAAKDRDVRTASSTEITGWLHDEGLEVTQRDVALALARASSTGRLKMGHRGGFEF